MALPGKFKAKKRKGKKPPKFSLWRAFSWVCATATEPIPNVISDSELAGWMFVLYVVAGWAYYNLSTGTLTFGDASYFLTATMTTVGYGDVTPAPTPHARLVGLAFVVVGNLVALSGLNELAAYLVELRDRVLASTRAAVLQAASAPPPSAENPGTGGGGSGSGGGPGRGSREASLEDLLDEDAAAMLAKFSKVRETRENRARAVFLKLDFFFVFILCCHWDLTAADRHCHHHNGVRARARKRWRRAWRRRWRGAASRAGAPSSALPTTSLSSPASASLYSTWSGPSAFTCSFGAGSSGGIRKSGRKELAQVFLFLNLFTKHASFSPRECARFIARVSVCLSARPRLRHGLCAGARVCLLSCSLHELRVSLLFFVFLRPAWSKT